MPGQCRERNTKEIADFNNIFLCTVYNAQKDVRCSDIDETKKYKVRTEARITQNLAGHE